MKRFALAVVGLVVWGLVTTAAPTLAQPFTAQIQRALLVSGFSYPSTGVTLGITQLFLGPATSTGVTATSATTDVQFTKVVTGIQDAAATAVLTLTVPNAANVSYLRVDVVGTLGAGGAIGAYEASCGGTFTVVTTRTVGVTVATGGSSLADSTGSVAVAGATSCTLARSLAITTSTAGATNVIEVRVTIAKGGGSSQNHRAVLNVRLINDLGGASATTVS